MPKVAQLVNFVRRRTFVASLTFAEMPHVLWLFTPFPFEFSTCLLDFEGFIKEILANSKF